MDKQEVLSGKRLIETSDVLNKPQESILFDSDVIPMPVRPHWHYYMELIYMLEGGIVMECDGVSAVIEPGEFYLVCPSVVHAMYARDGKHAKYEVLKFDVSKLHYGDHNTYVPKLEVILRCAKNDQHAPVLLSKDVADALDLGESMRRIREELADKPYGYDILVQSLLMKMMVEILRVWRTLGYLPDTAIAEDSDDVSIHSITAYIDDHAGEDLKVEKLATKCNMSYSYFAKSFHNLYGRSCKEYIELIRICKAEDLLLFTDCDLNYISQETGFADSSHLIKTFRKIKGITPKQFKTKNRKTAEA